MTQPSSAELADFLVEWREGPWPLDWERIFGRSAPLALEIGFGNGEFLLDQAQRSPERDHIGLELSWSAAARLLRRLATARLSNVRAVLADAEVALQRLFASESLAEVFVNHPCPWPKTRHHERRLLAPEGLSLLAERMRTGARLTVVTDHAEYAAWLARALLSQAALVSCHPSVEAPEPPGRRTTKYQRLAMAAGSPIHYFEWRKARPAAPVLLPSEPPDPFGPPGPMPSLTLQGRHDERALFEGFRPEIQRETRDGIEVAVRLLDVYRREPRDPHQAHPSPGAWLVEALVLEGRLRQQFAVLVVQRGERELLVKLADLARPYPTFGVKRALEAVARFLLTHHPELSLLHHNLGGELLSGAGPPASGAPAEDSEQE